MSYETGNTCHYCGCVLIRFGTPKTEPYYEDTGRTLPDGSPSPMRFKLKRQYGIASKDHKYPKSKGGNNSPGNILPACLRCNNEKRANTYERYMASIGKAPFDNIPMPRVMVIDIAMELGWQVTRNTRHKRRWQVVTPTGNAIRENMTTEQDGWTFVIYYLVGLTVEPEFQSHSSNGNGHREG